MNSQSKKTAVLRLRKIIKRVAIVFGMLFLIIAITVSSAYGIMYMLGKSSVDTTTSINLPTSNNANGIDEFGNIIYNGDKYTVDRDVITVLFMGVDKSIPETSRTKYGTGGQSDFILLVAYNTRTNTANIINVSRDIITDVEIYSVSGAYARTERTQLCLAYAYGDGKEKSCENVVKSVQRLFYDITISDYFAFDTNAIIDLTDAVGGVTVPEYNALGTAPTGNTVTLTGKDVMPYIRTRDSQQLDSNLSRMARQTNYVISFAKKVLTKSQSNIKVPINLFNIVSNSSVTTLDASKITYLTSLVLSSSPTMNFLSVPGNVVKGEDGYAEYIVDTEGFYELMLQCFYKKI